MPTSWQLWRCLLRPVVADLEPMLAESHRHRCYPWVAPCVPRPETRRRLQAYVNGLLSDTRRKNGWQLAETVGAATPYGFQHLLGRAAWSANAARDALYAYVAEHLGDPEGVVAIDETGFPKKGTHSAGVAPQYCGTLGKVGNCQVGVFLAYAGPRGHALLDRELYLPQAWTRNPAAWRPSGKHAAWPGVEPAGDPAPAVAPVAAGAGHGPGDPGLVVLAPPPPVGGAGLPLSPSTTTTSQLRTVVLNLSHDLLDRINEIETVPGVRFRLCRDFKLPKVPQYA